VVLFAPRCIYKTKSHLPQGPSSPSPPHNTLFHNAHISISRHSELSSAMINISEMPPIHKQHFSRPGYLLLNQFTRSQSSSALYSLNCYAVWKYKYSHDI